MIKPPYFFFVMIGVLKDYEKDFLPCFSGNIIMAKKFFLSPFLLFDQKDLYGSSLNTPFKENVNYSYLC